MDEERQVEQEQQPSKWTFGDRLLVILGIIMVLVIVIIAVCGYIGAFGWNWEWTGLTTPKQRTFWDWLTLLIVPIVLGLGGYLFTRSENRRAQEIAWRQRMLDQQIADRRDKLDEDIAEQHRQDDLLQDYLDHIGQLLLDKERSLRDALKGPEAQILARARTLTVLRRLNAERKGVILRFLQDADLISSERPRIDLEGADLSEAELAYADQSNTALREVNLKEANLHRADLRVADLSKAVLDEADLIEANLSAAKLSRADMIRAKVSRTDLSGANAARANLSKADLNQAVLNDADLTKTNLSDVDLTGADLTYANLSEAKLSGANLSGANLSGADLSSADLADVKGVTNEELEEVAKSLEGATMPNGQKYKEWLRDKEGC